jgi:hypothetical protein
MCRLVRTPRSKKKGRNSKWKRTSPTNKHDRGIKGRDDKSRGIEILMTAVFVKINPTDPYPKPHGDLAEIINY